MGGAIPDTCLVLDFDPRHNPRGLDELIDRAGDIPETLTSWSGRGDGGRHMFFTHHGGEFTSIRLPEGIDLKIGGRGYVILPPSPHPSTGLPYRWEHHPVTALPYALRELLRPAPRPVHTSRGGSSKASAGLVRTVAGATSTSGTTCCSGLRVEPSRKASLIKSQTS